MRFKNSILKAAFVVGLFTGFAHAAGNNNHTEIFVITSSSITATTNSTAIGTSYGDFNSVDFFVSVTSVTGTSPSMTPMIQVSPDDGVTWINHPVVTWTAITAVGSTGKANVDAGGASLIRLQYTVTGTTPMFATKAWAQARKK